MQDPRCIEIRTAHDALRPSPGLTGLLFEIAPDSPAVAGFPNRVNLPELIGNFEDAKRLAFDLASGIIHGAPTFRGMNFLEVHEEPIIFELQHAFHLIYLYRKLDSLGIRKCRFDSSSRWSDGLRMIARNYGEGIDIESGQGRARGNSISRSLGRLAKGRFSVRAIREEFSQVMARLDPYHRRARLLRLTRNRRSEANAIWFYSTAYTFTKIGISYEPYFPSPFQYLVEDPLTGGKPLDEAGRSYYNLYDLGEPTMCPSTEEVSHANAAILRHIKEFVLSGDAAIARDILLHGSWMETFLRRHVPRGLLHASLFERWANEVNPTALVVGNPGFERYSLRAAERRAIPTVLLQHGVLGDYCQYSDPKVDHYVVRGLFWRDFLSPAAREHVAILNPPDPELERLAVRTQPRQKVPKHILFVSAPYGLQEWWHLSDLQDIVLLLLRAAKTTELVIRVHPRETITSYQKIVDGLARQHQLKTLVSYSQGSGLEDAVSDAAVAVVYSSTVFLDCLRLGVPTIFFDWHDFSYKQQMRKYEAFYFARDLGDLRRLIEQGVAGTLHAKRADCSDFLAPTGRDEISNAFRAMIFGGTHR